MGGRVTHSGDRVRRRGRRSGSTDPSVGSLLRRSLTGRHSYLVRMLLVAVFGLGLAMTAPGIAQAEGEAVSGTLQTSRSGPIEGVEITVSTPDGEEIEQVTSDADGRWEVALPGPGQYVVKINADDLPEGVTLGGADTRTVTVDTGRRQPVNLSLEDGSRGAGSGGVQAIQLFVDGLRFGLLIAMCAVGLSLIYGTTGLTNFAHGELVTIGAVAAWYINVQGGVPLIPAALIAMVVGAAVGALNELGLWRPLRRRGTGLIAALVVSIGLSLLLRYLIQIVYGGRSNPYGAYQTGRVVSYGIF